MQGDNSLRKHTWRHNLRRRDGRRRSCRSGERGRDDAAHQQHGARFYKTGRNDVRPLRKIDAGGKDIIAVTIQRGVDRPYYLASKGLRPSGVYVRSGTSADPASDTAIRRMIKETDGDSFEAARSLAQDLTFKSAAAEFERHGVGFDQPKMKTLGIVTQDGLYSNLGLLLSDQCPATIKAATFSGVDQRFSKTGANLTARCSAR